MFTLKAVHIERDYEVLKHPNIEHFTVFYKGEVLNVSETLNTAKELIELHKLALQTQHIVTVYKRDIDSGRLMQRHYQSTNIERLVNLLNKGWWLTEGKASAHYRELLKERQAERETFKSEAERILNECYSDIYAALHKNKCELETHASAADDTNLHCSTVITVELRGKFTHTFKSTLNE